MLLVPKQMEGKYWLIDQVLEDQEFKQGGLNFNGLQLFPGTQD